jgi:hypothetical protein
VGTRTTRTAGVARGDQTRDQVSVSSRVHVYYLLNEKEKRRKHESDWRKQKRGGPKNEERTGWAEHDSDVAAEGVEGMVRELKAAMSAAAALVGG